MSTEKAIRPWRLQHLAVWLLCAATLAGCADGPALTRSGVPGCDRNGDEEQRVACAR